MLSQTICDHVPSSQLCSSTPAAGKMQSILWILLALSLLQGLFIRFTVCICLCQELELLTVLQHKKETRHVVKSSGQICRQWGTVHIFFLSSESGGQYLLPEKHQGSTVHFKATAANGEGIFVSALAKKQTPETWHFTWITGFLPGDAGDEKNSRIVSPQTTVLLNSFFHQKTLDY